MNIYSYPARKPIARIARHALWMFNTAIANLYLEQIDDETLDQIFDKIERLERWANRHGLAFEFCEDHYELRGETN